MEKRTPVSYSCCYCITISVSGVKLRVLKVLKDDCIFGQDIYSHCASRHPVVYMGFGKLDIQVYPIHCWVVGGWLNAWRLVAGFWGLTAMGAVHCLRSSRSQLRPTYISTCPTSQCSCQLTIVWKYDQFRWLISSNAELFFCSMKYRKVFFSSTVSPLYIIPSIVSGYP